MKHDQLTQDLAMIARNAIDYIRELERQRAEMLEALKELSLYVAYNGDDWVQRKARAAIAKAEGMTQPTALRLADVLDDWSDGPDTSKVTTAAATELRRLHAALIESELWRGRDEACAANAERERDIAEAQRDALLEALKVVIDDLMYKDHARVIDVARAAIAKAEENK